VANLPGSARFGVSTSEACSTMTRAHELVLGFESPRAPPGPPSTCHHWTLRRSRVDRGDLRSGGGLPCSAGAHQAASHLRHVSRRSAPEGIDITARYAIPHPCSSGLRPMTGCATGQGDSATFTDEGSREPPSAHSRELEGRRSWASLVRGPLDAPCSSRHFLATR
jgi:hypothetical protein